MDSLRCVCPHHAFLHLRRAPPLSPDVVLSSPLLPPSLFLPPSLSPGLSLLALVSRGHQSQSPGYPEGKQRDLEMRSDCPGLCPAHCSDCSCYWPGSLPLSSCCPGIGHPHYRSPGIGWQQRLEEGQWKEPSCQSNVLMLEDLG